MVGRVSASSSIGGTKWSRTISSDQGSGVGGPLERRAKLLTLRFSESLKAVGRETQPGCHQAGAGVIDVRKRVSNFMRNHMTEHQTSR